MEKRIEKWESLRLEAQQFTPKDYFAACESTTSITLEHLPVNCSSGYVKCSGFNNEIKDHFDHAEQVTFNPPINQGVDAIREFWAKAFALVNASPEFEVYCDNGLYQGSSRVISRGSAGVDTVTLDNIDTAWHSGHCDMRPSDDGNPNRVLVVNNGWQVLQNHSG